MGGQKEGTYDSASSFIAKQYCRAVAV